MTRPGLGTPLMWARQEANMLSNIELVNLSTQLG